jgi:hypothetical protein
MTQSPFQLDSAGNPNDLAGSGRKPWRPCQICQKPMHTGVSLTDPTLSLAVPSRSRRPFSVADRREKKKNDTCTPCLLGEFLDKSLNNTRRNCADCMWVLWVVDINVRDGRDVCVILWCGSMTWNIYGWVVFKNEIADDFYETISKFTNDFIETVCKIIFRGFH